MTKIRQISMKIKTKANSLDKNGYFLALLFVFVFVENLKKFTNTNICELAFLTSFGSAEVCKFK